jgi:hypothetical protein
MVHPKQPKQGALKIHNGPKHGRSLVEAKLGSRPLAPKQFLKAQCPPAHLDTHVVGRKRDGAATPRYGRTTHSALRRSALASPNLWLSTPLDILDAMLERRDPDR